MGYKWCVVPQCTSTSIHTPQKLFVSVPCNPERRRIWLQLARRDPNSISSKSKFYMCEDHIDIEKDTSNYMQYTMGFSKKILLRDDAVPTKFYCQERKRQLSDDRPSQKAVIKRLRNGTVQICLQSKNATDVRNEILEKDQNEIEEIVESEATKTENIIKTMANGSATYCLLCAELKPLAEEVINVENQMEEIISKLTRINATVYLHSVNLPKKICLQCISLLNRAYEFVLAVERAQHALLALNRNIKQEKYDNFEATETMIEIKIEQEVENVSVGENPLICEVDPPDSSQQGVENVGVGENPLICEVDPPDSSINAPVDTSISKTTVKNENKTIKSNTKPKRKKKKCQTPAINLSSTWRDYIWKCGFCDTEFPTHMELKTHAMECHKCCNPQKCYDCNAGNGNLECHIKHVHRHRKHLSYSCYKCFKTFPTPCKAGTHRHSHTRQSHYCKGCNTTFETENQLKDHMSTYYRLFCDRTAPKTDDVYCKECDKTYDNPKALTKHIKKVHTNLKNDYTCDTCGKCFPRKEYLASHMNIHSDERPYPCTICTARFKQQSHLYRHLRTHLAENPYTCDVCNRGFKFKKYLQNHQIIHTDLAPHVCSYCDKGFKFAVNLKNHLRQHTGDRPYICSVCNRQFTCWANWNKHSKRRHNMDMSKRKPVVLKEYVDTVRNKKKSGRKRKKPITKVIEQVPSENFEHS